MTPNDALLLLLSELRVNVAQADNEIAGLRTKVDELHQAVRERDATIEALHAYAADVEAGEHPKKPET